MIEYLNGIVRRKLPTGIILECQGVGYSLIMPLSYLADVADVGNSFAVWVYTRVREDAITLYGFLTYEQRQTFDVLLQISGVGPKVGIAILSTLDLIQLREAIEYKQVEILEVVPGIGRRSAEKIMLELGNKLEKLPAINFSSRQEVGKSFCSSQLKFDQNSSNGKLKIDLISALANLGFKERQILPVIDAVLEENQSQDFAFLIKKSLALLSGDKRPSKTSDIKIDKIDPQRLF